MHTRVHASFRHCTEMAKGADHSLFTHPWNVLLPFVPCSNFNSQPQCLPVDVTELLHFLSVSHPSTVNLQIFRKGFISQISPERKIVEKAICQFFIVITVGTLLRSYLAQRGLPAHAPCQLVTCCPYSKKSWQLCCATDALK